MPTSPLRRPEGLRVLLLLLALGTPAPPCSCPWQGPFLQVARQAPLVVRARILRHHAGPEPVMDVLVLETLAGGLLDTGLQIQMDNGALCRPAIGLFPVGSEWILAINGPGAKPGRGLAISVCGEYWLRVDGETVAGSLDGQQGQVRRMALAELRLRLRHPRFSAAFAGSVKAGEAFRRTFGTGFAFHLEPRPDGWEVVVRAPERAENLARLTPPLHGLPNPRDLEAWHFAEPPAPCPRPYPDQPPPPRTRTFIFSPDVGRSLQGPDAGAAPTAADIEAVKRFGQGVLHILAVALERDAGGCPRIARLDFRVELTGGF